jgi:hypothetical protein
MPASALGSLCGQPSRRLSSAFELLEQVERGSWDDNHELSLWIVCIDFGDGMQHFLALSSLISYQEITRHLSEPAFAWLPVKSTLLRTQAGGQALHGEANFSAVIRMPPTADPRFGSTASWAWGESVAGSYFEVDTPPSTPDDPSYLKLTRH